jgi:hypothetical protein
VRKYGYDKSPLLAIRFFQVSGVVSIVFGTAFSCELLFAGILMGPSRWGISCFSIWAFAIAWLIGSFFINMYPTIWLEEANLVVSVFFFWQAKIKWAEMLSVDLERTSRGDTIVTARKITPIHHLYGWFYLRALTPAFVIRRDIDNHDELVREIKKRASLSYTN